MEAADCRPPGSRRGVQAAVRGARALASGRQYREVRAGRVHPKVFDAIEQETRSQARRPPHAGGELDRGDLRARHLSVLAVVAWLIIPRGERCRAAAAKRFVADVLRQPGRGDGVRHRPWPEWAAFGKLSVEAKAGYDLRRAIRGDVIFHGAGGVSADVRDRTSRSPSRRR
jgi:hypothetical protein